MKKTLHILTEILMVLLVFLPAVLVRAPSARLAGTSDDLRQEFMNGSGQIYMMEMDSYYHTRITDNYLEYGSFGNSVTEKGKPWDTISYFPEGRTAEYQPGIVYLTTAVWKVLNSLTGTSLYSVELWIAAFMAAISGAIAFLFVRRISNAAGGFVAGILVSCQPVFVERTLPGRYDTDMFVVLMDVLLIFLFAETLRAETLRGRWISFAGFVLTMVVYTMCWSRYSVLLGAMTVAGGFLYLLVLFIRFAVKTDHGRGRDAFRNGFFRQPEVRMFLICTCMAAALILLIKGPEYVIGALRNVIPSTVSGQSAVEPDIFSSIVELEAAKIFPKQPIQWFLSYVPGQQHTILSGLGGLPTVVLCIGGIALLALHMARPDKLQGFIPLKRRESAIYFCILSVWIVGCFFAARRGVRFVEHMGVPTGLAAGSFVGWITPSNIKENAVRHIVGILVSAVICLTAVILPLSGALSISRYVQPAVTDASADAMEWIKKNAEDPEAVIASWWDMGYYYEDASGHPAFWDGGSQTGIRSILISRALTSHDPEESRRILQMLAHEGDWPVEWLKKRLGGKKAFEAFWRVLPLEKKETVEILTGEYGLDENQASTIDRKIHPSEEKEIYLVLTNNMMNMLGWFEYYADWDFEGNNRRPLATVYYIKADGTEVMNSQQKDLQGYFKERSEETIWRLFLRDGEQQSVFTKVYETTDTFTNVQIWKA